MQNVSDDKKIEDKKPVRKRATKVVEKVEKEVKGKTAEIVAETKKRIEPEKKLEKSVASKKKVYIEYYGKQVSEEIINEKLIQRLKEDGFKGTIKSLEVYYKTEEEVAYCVINQGEPIAIKMF
jgi:RNase P/RNase MRP subunit p29